MLIVLNLSPTFNVFLPVGLIMLCGATLIDLNSLPCGVSGIGNGNPGHFYVTFVQCVQ